MPCVWFIFAFLNTLLQVSEMLVVCHGKWVLLCSQGALSIWEGCSGTLNTCDRSWTQGPHLQTPAAILVGNTIMLCHTMLCWCC